MRNIALLVRKDLISALITKSNLVTVIIMSLFLIAVNPPLVFVLVVYIMVINLFAAEENDLVCNVTGILPIRMGQAILARYVYAWALLLVTTIVGGAVSFGINLFTHTNDDWFSSILVALAAALLMLAIIMPLNYKLGVARARIASMIVYVLMVVVSTTASTLMNIDAEKLSVPAEVPPITAIAGFALLAGVLLSILSLFISLQIKKN